MQINFTNNIWKTYQKTTFFQKIEGNQMLFFFDSHFFDISRGLTYFS